MGELTIVMYHYVRELRRTRYPKIKGLNISEFKHQIEFLRSRYSFVSMEDVLEAIYNDKKLPQNSVLLTFDDGYIDHYRNVFPILKLNGIQGVFSMPAKILNERKLLDVNKIHYILAGCGEKEVYENLCKKLDYYRGIEYLIPSNEEIFFEISKEENRLDSVHTLFVKRALQIYLPLNLREKITDELFKECILDQSGLDEDVFIDETYMNMDQIRLMKQEGMYFAHHGYAHEWLGSMDKNDMEEDIIKALNFWKETNIINEWNWVMCYPYGSYSEDVIKYIQEKGCKAAISTDRGLANLVKDDIFKLKRLDTVEFVKKNSEL